jgi:preprotein translocase subunit SecE
VRERNFSRDLEREVMATQAAKMSKEEQGGTGSELTHKVTGTVQNAGEFLQETRVEMKKVTWPSREDVVSTTGVVLATVAFFAIYLYFVEQGAARAVGYLLKRFGGA